MLNIEKDVAKKSLRPYYLWTHPMYPYNFNY